MKTRRSHARATVVALAAMLAATLFATPAVAQFDHLKCFKAKDQKTFKKAHADLTALQAQFGIAEDCEIKPKAKLYCVPATKTVTSIVEGQDTPFPAEDLVFDRLCYQIKCPKVEIPDQEVSDQFGTRQVTKLQAKMICTPAVEGPAPTTTSTSTTSTTMGGGCVDGAMQQCGSDVGACVSGVKTCSGGVFGPCVGEVGPSAEVCDGVDNDCDGVVDNGNPGGGASCLTGLLGVCAAGTTQCQAGALVCAQNVSPSTEICDGLDNNCDGVVDEGFDLANDPNNCGACGTVCIAPTPTCSSGTCIP